LAVQDHFSGHASVYAGARPHYPAELFDYLASLCGSKETAWDCACGNGQASLGLANHFQSVIASDASIEQLLQAQRHPAIHFVQGEAENHFLADASVDLVCVAQALHWFEVEKFFQVASTVLKPGGVIAAWSYRFTRIGAAVDKLVDYLYELVLGLYWPAERKLIENAYSDLEFPFSELAAPEFEMEKSWTLEELLPYLEPWSALQRYVKANEKHPLTELVSEFRIAWGDDEHRKVIWPLSLRIGKVQQ